MSGPTWRLIEGDATAALGGLPDATFGCCVTSPPYWGGVRDYGMPGQIGLERDPAGWVAVLVGVFREARRVLRPDGCLWLNVGEVFAASGKGGGGVAGDRGSWDTVRERKGFRMPPNGYKMKDQSLAPFLLADALRRDGWYLRSTVVWSKSNATEPKRLDRPSQSHEYVFLLARSEQYTARDPGEPWWGRSVWEIAAGVCVGHPATMPFELARRCIVCCEGAVLDPFVGSGTTGAAALTEGRPFVGIDLNADYVKLARRRCGSVSMPLFASPAVPTVAAPESSLFAALGPDEEEKP